VSPRALAQPATGTLSFSLDRLVKIVRDSRKDPLMIDFARQAATRYADMVDFFARREGNPVDVHNNKALFAEGLHLWFRYYFSEGADFRGPSTQNPRDVIAHVMSFWYQAMEKPNPADYRSRLTPPPVYAGSLPEVVAYLLGACACLEIQPLQFRFGIQGGKPVHVWARILADGKWYDSDVSRQDFKLGDRLKFDSVEEVEVPIFEADGVES
jgi:hypothetical protein